MSISDLRIITSETNLTGRRSGEINDAIEAMQCCVRLLCTSPNGSDREYGGVLARMSESLQETVKLQCIAVMRSNAHSHTGVFGIAQQRKDMEEKGPMPDAVHSYLVALFHDALEIRGSIGGNNKKSVRRAVGKLTAYHKPEYVEELFNADTAIGAKLTEEGVTMTEEEIRKVFTKSVRMHFAVHNIGDPLGGVSAWIRGDITCIGSMFAARSN